MMRYLIPLLLLASCAQNRQSPPQSKRYIDTIFLGYRFSMTEEDFQKHTHALLDSGVLIIKDDMIAVPFADYFATFSPTYDAAKKVRELGVSFQGKHPKMMLVDVYGKVAEKYWNPDKWKESPGYLKGSTTFTYTDGNLQISIIEGMSDARLFYLNLQADQDSVVPNVSPSIF